MPLPSSHSDSRTFGGIRECLAEEFDYIYIVDTRSDVSRHLHQRKAGPLPRPHPTLKDEQRREKKLDRFRETRFRDLPSQRIHPEQVIDLLRRVCTFTEW
jgi:hypothetical protein